MKKMFLILGLLLAMGIPALAQSQQMSPDDQGRFNSYYSRWLQYKQTNDRDDMIGMKQRIQDPINRNGIPSKTPITMLPSQPGYPGPGYSGQNETKNRHPNTDSAVPCKAKMHPNDQK